MNLRKIVMTKLFQTNERRGEKSEVRFKETVLEESEFRQG